MTGDLSKREQGQRDRREKLLTAASLLFARDGFVATTAEDIATSAGVSRATFFNYFGSKEAVATALHERRMEELYSYVDYLLSLDASTAELIVMVFEDIARTDERQPGVLRAEIESMEGGSPSPALRAERTARLVAQLLRILRRGQQRGEVRTDHPLPFLAEMVAAIYQSVVSKWTGNPDLAVRREFARAGRFAASVVAQAE